MASLADVLHMIRSSIRMKKKVTIQDIAKAAGTSLTTVSFILNGKAQEKKISEKVTKRVLDYAKRQGYKSATARATPQPLPLKTVGLLLDRDTAIFQQDFIALLNIRLREAGYYLISTCVADTPVQELIALYVQQQVAALLIFTADDVASTVALDKLGMPTILVHYDPTLQQNNTVFLAEESAITAGITQVFAQGVKRLGFLSYFAEDMLSKIRQQSYMDTLDKLQEQSYIKKIKPDLTVLERKEEICDFMETNKLDALLISSDDLLLEAIQYKKDIGLPLTTVLTFVDHKALRYLGAQIYSIQFELNDVVPALVDSIQNLAAGKSMPLLKLQAGLFSRY